MEQFKKMLVEAIESANIKRVADEYKGIIADNVYNALYNWQIEITD